MYRIIVIIKSNFEHLKPIVDKAHKAHQQSWMSISCLVTTHLIKSVGTNLKKIYFRNKIPTKHYISSSLMHGIKHNLTYIEDHTCWKIGNGLKIDLWLDKWLPYKIKDMHMILSENLQYLQYSFISNIMQNRNWNIPTMLQYYTPKIAKDILEAIFPIMVSRNTNWYGLAQTM